MQPNNSLALAPASMFLAPSSIFDKFEELEKYKELAKTFSEATHIPESFQKKPSECLVAIEYAANLGLRPLMVMQNLHVVKGKPSWDGKFVGMVIRTCGRFKNVRYVMGEAGVVAEAWVQGAYEASQRKVTNVPNLTCYISAIEVATGDEIKGSTISIQMAVSEGWYGNKGSKWPNMPEQMLSYRAASFFGRLHVQDYLLGMHTADEVQDMQISYPDAGTGAVEVAGAQLAPATSGRQQRPRAARPEPAQVPVMQVVQVEPAESTEPDLSEQQNDNDPARMAAPYGPGQTVAENSTPAPAPAPVEPSPASIAQTPAQATPAASTAQTTDPAEGYELTADTLRICLKLTKDPVVGTLTEPEAALLKSFAAAYPNLVIIPRTRRGKVEFTQEGNEWLGEQDFTALAGEGESVQPSGLALADPEDLERAVEENTTAAGDEDTSKSAQAAQGIETPQETRDRIQRQQYPAAQPEAQQEAAPVESAADKFLRDRKEKEAGGAASAATTAEDEPTPEADKVVMPKPLANLF